MRRVCEPAFEGAPGDYCGESFDDLHQVAVCPHPSLNGPEVTAESEPFPVDDSCQAVPDDEPAPAEGDDRSVTIDPPAFMAATCGNCRGLGVVVDDALTEQIRSGTGRALTVVERCSICCGSGGLLGPRR